jgi:hypothetical protein
MDSNWKRYTVEESRSYRHKATERKVSIFGALPWRGDAEKLEWELVVNGFTIRDHNANTVGCGRAPWTTQAEAQTIADRWNEEYLGRVEAYKKAGA